MYAIICISLGPELLSFPNAINVKIEGAGRSMNDVIKIGKLDAAERQLVTAIRIFFFDYDPVSVHTLAYAASEIYEQACRRAGLPTMFDLVETSNPTANKKELRDTLNGARNFFKHFGDKAMADIEFSDELNDFVLLGACDDCRRLTEPTPPVTVLVFGVWFSLTNVLELNKPLEQASLTERWARSVEPKYPGIRTADRAEKKRFGRALLAANGVA